MLRGQGLAVGLVGDQCVFVLERGQGHVGGKTLLGLRDDEARARLRVGQCCEVAPMDALEAGVEAAPPRDAVDVQLDLGGRERGGALPS